MNTFKKMRFLKYLDNETKLMYHRFILNILIYFVKRKS